jgi:hypothetical protein
MAKKGARQSGGTAARKRVADQAMAARIKNEKRTTGNCPICHKPVALDKLPFGHACGRAVYTQ